MGRFSTCAGTDGLANAWVGTTEGPTRIGADGAMTTYTSRDGLPSPNVWSLAENHQGNLRIGGRIRFESEGRGEGCTFSFSLPPRTGSSA